MSRIGFVAILLLAMSAACDSSTEPELNQLTLTIAGAGAGEVRFSVVGASGSTCTAVATMSCIGRYSNSEVVALSAVPEAGSEFGGWSGICTGTAVCFVAMTTDRNITATFNLE